MSKSHRSQHPKTPLDGNNIVESDDFNWFTITVCKYINTNGPIETTDLEKGLNAINLDCVLQQMRKDGMIDISPEIGWYLTD